MKLKKKERWREIKKERERESEERASATSGQACKILQQCGGEGAITTTFKCSGKRPRPAPAAVRERERERKTPLAERTENVTNEIRQKRR